MQSHGFIEKFNLDTVRLMRFLGKYYLSIQSILLLSIPVPYSNYMMYLADISYPSDLLVLVEESYHPDNCYHNSTHAADVTQALNCLLMNEVQVCRI
jgi:hypothetical protein